MHPLLLLFLVLSFSSSKSRSPFSAAYIQPPIYFDTFRMELLLDRLHAVTEALEKLNHLNQVSTLPPTKENSLNRLQDSLEAAKGFLADTKAEKQLDTISNTVSGLKQFGDMEQLLSAIGPILSMLSQKSSSNVD